MPKGRAFFPSRDREGVWFQHLGPKLTVLSIEEEMACRAESKPATTTRRMQTDPFNSAVNYYPPDPPETFQKRNMATHDFSKYDNRHVFQGHGVYFGNGRDTRTLGKRMGKNFEERPHFTEPDFLTHYGRIVMECDFNTIYADNYRGCQLSREDAKAFQRSFPKNYPMPKADSRVRCDPKGFKGAFRESTAPCVTPMEVLGKSRLPYPQDTGRWKYSYHGLPRCYPILDTVKEKEIPEISTWNDTNLAKRTCSDIP